MLKDGITRLIMKGADKFWILCALRDLCDLKQLLRKGSALSQWSLRQGKRGNSLEGFVVGHNGEYPNPSTDQTRWKQIRAKPLNTSAGKSLKVSATLNVRPLCAQREIHTSISHPGWPRIKVSVFARCFYAAQKPKSRDSATASSVLFRSSFQTSHFFHSCVAV